MPDQLWCIDLAQAVRAGRCPHRAPERRGQVSPLCDEGLPSDRIVGYSIAELASSLLCRRPCFRLQSRGRFAGILVLVCGHDSGVGLFRIAEHHRSARPGRNDRPSGSRYSDQVQPVEATPRLWTCAVGRPPGWPAALTWRALMRSPGPPVCRDPSGRSGRGSHRGAGCHHSNWPWSHEGTCRSPSARISRCCERRA